VIDSLSEAERSVLLGELLRIHPELIPEAENITSGLLIVEDERTDEVTERLRALRADGPLSVEAAREGVAEVVRRYIADFTWRAGRGARQAAADAGIAVLLGLYECREDTDPAMILVRAGLPGAVDETARMVYRKLKELHLSLPALTDECPEWSWYAESWE